jgi:hypothetical protein
MANKPDKDKAKYTYFDNKDVLNTLKQIANERSKAQGGYVTVPEVIRKATLALANEYLRKHNKQEIKYEWRAGKFAPGSASSAARCEVDLQAKMNVFDKRGKKMREWNHIAQLPQLLRLCPKCKVVYAGDARFHRVYDESGAVLETHESAGDFREAK